MAAGHVVRVRLGEDGRFAPAPAERFTSAAAPMRRPCGMRFGPLCGSLFVACMEPAVLRFAGGCLACACSLWSFEQISSDE